MTQQTDSTKAAREAAFSSGLRPETLRPASEGWEAPTGSEIRYIVTAAGLTGTTAGKLLGVDPRMLRRWIGEDKPLPFAAWALLIHAAGLGIIWKKIE